MASYLRAWLGIEPYLSEPSPQLDTDVSISFSEPSPPPSEHADDGDDDEPPMFPSLDSIQRSGAPVIVESPSTSNRPPSPDSLRMPPPPIPASRNSLSTQSSLALPLTTIRRPPNTNSKAKAREKVALAPGHSPLDWARLKSSGQDLRGGVTSIMRVTPSQLKLHNTPEDAWSSFEGKVYNITPYLTFHPGGQKELMRAAGRDGTKLFALTHSWVNLDYMLDGCLVGFLVPESHK